MTESTLKMWEKKFYDDYGFDPPSDEALQDYIEEQSIGAYYDTMEDMYDPAEDLEGLDDTDLY